MRITLAVALTLAACQETGSIRGIDTPTFRPDPPGIEAPRRTETVVQMPRAEADVLFVVDITPTMADVLPVLYRNLPVMMEFFADSDLDYHVGVTNTAKRRNGRLFDARGYRWVDRDTPDPVGVFTDMVNSVPMHGGAPPDESGIGTTYMALELQKDGYNEGFLRDRPALHVIVFSDEEDQTFGDPITEMGLISYLNGLKSVKEDVTFNSVVCMRGEPCLNRGGSLGDNYIRVTRAVGGVVWSVDDPEFDQLLYELAFQAVGASSEFFLSEVPVPGSIELWIDDEGMLYDGVDLDSIPEGRDLAWACEQQGCSSPVGFTYDQRRNSVRVHDDRPGPLAEVTIRYRLFSEHYEGGPGFGDEREGRDERGEREQDPR